MSPEQATDGIKWTAELVFPMMVGAAELLAPPGVVAVEPAGGPEFKLGEGSDTVAAISGPAADVFQALWGREPATTTVHGDDGLVDWWKQVPGQAFQIPALG